MILRHLAAIAMVSAGLLAPTIASPAASAAPLCPAAQSGKITVTIVIDYGSLAGAPTSIDSRCIALTEGATGFDALIAYGGAAGLPGPRTNSSGLVCGVGGLPAEECGAASGSGYRYWSYWLSDGASAWRYATTGPSSRRLRQGDLEGWRFINGTGSSTDNAPRILPQDAAGVAPTTTAPRPTSPPTTAATQANVASATTVLAGATPQPAPQAVTPRVAAATGGAASPSAGNATVPTAATDPTSAGSSLATTPDTVIDATMSAPAAMGSTTTTTTPNRSRSGSKGSTGAGSTSNGSADNDDRSNTTGLIAAGVFVLLAAGLTAVQVSRKRLRGG